MRTALFSVILLALYAASPPPVQAQEYWLPVSSPTTHHLRALTFTDSLYGWACGNLGTMIRTTDGGVSWSLLNPGVTDDIVDVCMLNRNTGWALALDIGPTTIWSIILFTTDGGSSWRTETYPEPDVVLNAVSFQDSLHGWVAGENGQLAGSADGGRTWVKAVLDSGLAPLGDLRKIRFMTPSYGYVTGGRFDLTGTIWRTWNGGAFWSAMGAAPEPINDVHFIDSLHVIGVTGDYDYGSGLVRTTDAGVTWNYTYLGIWGDARGLAFRTPAEGWAVLGFAGRCMVTRDTGATWQSFFTPETSSVSDIQFLTERRGIMVGADGRIFRFDPEAVSVPVTDAVPAQTRLLPPYPNPFNATTALEFEIGERAQVRLQIVDITGRIVATLVDGMRDKGTYAAVFNAGSLASGIYFCRLQLLGPESGFSATARLLLLR
jgi:photosystem II stability/assembly factor-like uncharacterized protein